MSSIIDFSVQRNAVLEFRLEEFCARKILMKRFVMNQIGLKFPEIAQVIGLAAVNGLQDRGQKSDLNIIIQ